MLVVAGLSYNSGCRFFTGFCFLCIELQDSNMSDLDPKLTGILK